MSVRQTGNKWPHRAVFKSMTEDNSASSGTPVKPVTRLQWLATGLAVLLSSVSGGVLSDQVPQGKLLVMAKSKGNCAACHMVADVELPGNIGPPLISMKARFPEPRLLFEQIWDASGVNPDSRMPPFGRHGILTSEEIDQIVEYLYTL